ncbi:hypothetical protein C8R44DRAFT_888051 [Mycena epipterygia]|nr:hypothetical protein C8R44DRAFT_888051 [Mycena epipterygia]
MALRADLLCPSHPCDASPSCSALLSLALRDTSLSLLSVPSLLSFIVIPRHVILLLITFLIPRLLTIVDATPHANLGAIHEVVESAEKDDCVTFSTSDLSSDPDLTYLLRPASCSTSDRVVCLSNTSAPLLPSFPRRSFTLLAPSSLLLPPSPFVLPPPVSRRAVCSIASSLTLSCRPPSTLLPPILSCPSHSYDPTLRVVSHSSKSCPLPRYPIASLPCTASRIPTPSPVSPHITTVPASSFLAAALFPPARRCLLSSSTQLSPLPLHVASSALFRVPACLLLLMRLTNAPQANKIRNRVFKLTGAVQRNKIRIAHGRRRRRGHGYVDGVLFPLLFPSPLYSTLDSRLLYARAALTAVTFPFATFIPYLRPSLTHPRRARLLPSLF